MTTARDLDISGWTPQPSVPTLDGSRPNNSKPTGVISITGSPIEGQVLTASDTIADADGLGAFIRKWQQSNVDVVGETAAMITLSIGHTGDSMRHVITYTDGESRVESVSSVYTAVITALGGGATSFIGIPDPDFGSVLGNPITVTTKLKLASWTANTGGWYYVRSGGTNSGNGYPGDPKGTIPSTLAAGDTLVLDGSFTGSSLTITCSGTILAPIWIINDIDGTAVDIQRNTSIEGDYTMVDGVNWSNMDDNFLDHNSGSNYICVRNGTATGTAVHATNSAGYGPGGSSTTGDNTNIVMDSFTITAFGDYTNNTNIDVHGIKPRNNIQDLWITNCVIYRNGADGVQTGEANGVNGTDRPTRIYLAGNVVYENRENGFDIKSTVNIVMSQNNLYASQGNGDSGPPTEIVIHNVSDGVHVIYNDIHDTSSGVVASNTVDKTFIIGNHFRNILGATTDTYYGAGVCINLYSATVQNSMIHGNTFYNFNKGISSPVNGVIDEISSNIFAGRVGNYYDIGIDFTGGVPGVNTSNYNLFENPRFYHDTVYSNGISSVPGGFEANSVDAAAGFTNAAGGDFTLAAGSAAIGAGRQGPGYATFNTDIGVAILVDYDGNARPAASNDWDIGAHERAA